MKKFKQILLSSILLGCLQLTSLATAAEADTQVLYVDSNSIYSISVIPNKRSGATSYTLEIYTKADQKIPQVSLTHLLRGQISNVDIVEKNGKEELIIETTSISSTSSVHRDVFILVEDNILNNIKRFFVKS